MSQTYNIPLWVGEFGENSNHWSHKKVQLFENNDVSWSLWNYKHNGSIASAMRVEVPQGFQTIIDYWNGSGPVPSAEQAMTGLMDLADAYLFENCVTNKGLVAALSDSDYDGFSKPFTDLTVPNTIEAVDYDIGVNGVAYNDEIYEDPDKFGSNSESWNNGWAYRNDGVDIEYSSDPSGNGYNIGWIDTGEWLKYTVQAEFTGAYKFSFKTSAQHDNGKILITVQGQTGSVNFPVPNTGGYQNWVWTDTASVHLAGGENIIRLEALNGGFNLKSIKIEGTNPNPLPDNYSIWNYPNPFNTETTFYFSDNIESDGQLTIYDNSGHIVQNIEINQNQSSVTWNGKDRYGLAAGSGIYIYQVKFDQKKIAGKMTLIR